ncbi:MATE family efflux transporter [Methanobrevibacter sp.]|uniref:MATE family efflux transporter n=1 Tax=Methanobrevibacter sp. TaxID=66852 RepID=UPI00388DEF28
MYERNHDLISSKFKEFFFPTLLTAMAGNICIVVDSILVSFFIGVANLSAIQLVSPLVTFVNLIYWMIGLGGSILCSVSKAEFDDESSNSYFSASISSLCIMGIIITIIGLIFSKDILGILCKSQQLLPMVNSFYMVILFEMPFLCYVMSVSYFVRVDGMPNLAFRAILLANIVNLCCDIIFLGVLKMGIGGAALATVVGYAVGSIFISTYFFKSERTLKFIKLKVKPFINKLKEICKSGFPSSSTQLYFTIKIYIYNVLITLFVGEAGIAAFSICDNSTFILYMFLIGASQTMSSLVSVYFKEEDYSSVSYIVKKSLKFALISSVAFSLIIIVCPNVMLMLYSVKDPSFVSTVLNALRIFAISFVGVAITFLFTFYSQAIQKNSVSSIVSLLEGLIFPCGSAAILLLILGENGIWISFTVAEVATILFIFIYSRYLNRKTDGEYTGFFINKRNDDKKVFEYTIKGNVKEAVELAHQVQDYLSGNKSATLVSLAIEEMLVNIINTNENVDAIDVIVRNNDDNILISIKDTGIDFNPVIENENLEFDNISVLNKIADKIDYSRVLGLNSTVITIKN